MAPPVRVLAPSGSLLLLSVLLLASLVSVRTVTVAVGGVVVVWRLRRYGRVRVGWKFEAAVWRRERAESARGGTGAMVVVEV
jgi:hypothetical protein